MFSATNAIRSAGKVIAVLLLLVCADVSAQAYSPAMLERFEPAPPLVLAHAPSTLHALQDDLDPVEGFSFSKRRAHGVTPVIQQERWTLYGRFGLVRFRNNFDPNGNGAQVTWRTTGPGLDGKRLFIGFQRRF